MAEILLLEDEESVNRGIEFTLKKRGTRSKTPGQFGKHGNCFKSRNQSL